MAYERSYIDRSGGVDNRVKKQMPAEYPEPLRAQAAAPATQRVPAAQMPFVPQPPKQMKQMATAAKKFNLPLAMPLEQFKAETKPVVPPAAMAAGYPLAAAPAMMGVVEAQQQAPWRGTLAAGQYPMTQTKTGAMVGFEQALKGKIGEKPPTETEVEKEAALQKAVAAGAKYQGVAGATPPTPPKEDPQQAALDADKEIAKGNMAKVQADLDAMEEGWDQAWFDKQYNEGMNQIEREYQAAIQEQAMASSLGGMSFSGAAAAASGALNNAKQVAGAKLKVDLVVKFLEAQRQDKLNKLQLRYAYASDAQKLILDEERLYLNKKDQALREYVVLQELGMTKIKAAYDLADEDIRDVGAYLDAMIEYGEYLIAHPNATYAEADAELMRLISQADKGVL